MRSLKNVFKRILKSDGFRAFACWLGAGLIRFVHLTNRWQVVRREIPEAFWRDDKPFIVCFWHGRIMMMNYCWDTVHPINMLISEHQDGRLIAGTNAYFGIRAVAGSTNKGGARALRSMVKSLAAGEYAGITPDGPRGPRMRASDGVIAVAKLSGVPILPVSFSTSRGKHLNSWDRFLVAKPFGRGVIVWGEPIHVDRNADVQASSLIRQQVEDSLNWITREADEMVGRTPVDPAPLPESSEGQAL